MFIPNRDARVTQIRSAVLCSPSEFNHLEGFLRRHNKRFFSHRDTGHQWLVERCIRVAEERFPTYKFDTAISELMENNRVSTGPRTLREASPGAPILIFVFGGGGRFRVFPYPLPNPKDVIEFPMFPGDMYALEGRDMQHTCRHDMIANGHACNIYVMVKGSTHTPYGVFPDSSVPTMPAYMARKKMRF